MNRIPKSALEGPVCIVALHYGLRLPSDLHSGQYRQRARLQVKSKILVERLQEVVA